MSALFTLYVCASFDEYSGGTHLVSYVSRSEGTGSRIKSVRFHERDRWLLLGTDPITPVRREALKASQRWAERVDIARNPF